MNHKGQWRFPAEWEKHEACWLAWPSHAELWLDLLPKVQLEFKALCQAISGVDVPGSPFPEEPLEVLVPDSANERLAELALEGLPVRFHRIPFGDIWLRDTAPLFLTSAEGELAASCFRFNGWGGKYELPYDSEVAIRVARKTDSLVFENEFVLEGGSIEVDGRGTCLTTEQCLLNSNRNPGYTKSKIEEHLVESIGISKVLWLEQGLLNDHTDGHIDTLVRFIRPGEVVCMVPTENSDPNKEVLKSIRESLNHFTDVHGHRLKVHEIPSPGLVTSSEAEIMPASYVNFYIANRTVVVPTYGVAKDSSAVDKLSQLFPDRKVVGLSARAILEGGGAFHCITQQQPVVEVVP